MDRTPKSGNRAKTPDSVENVRLAHHVRATLKRANTLKKHGPNAKKWKPGKNSRLPGKRPTSAARARDAENWPIRRTKLDRTPKRGNQAKTPDSVENARLAQHVRAALKTGQYVEETWT